MYAYRTSNDDGICKTGNSDDGECGGSSILVKLMRDEKVENMFVAVSRIHRGPNLGKRRFELIEQACADVLKL